jgi:MYXO-CTERM domain-containing protein
MKKTTSLIVPGALLVGSLAGAASGAFQFYDNEADFLAAVNGAPLAFEDFESAAPNVPLSSFSNLGATWSAPDTDVFAVTDGAFPIDGQALTRNVPGPGSLRAAFDEPTFAFGGFVASAHPTVFGTDIQVLLTVEGEQFSIGLDDSDNYFIGVVSDEAFNLAELTAFAQIDGGLPEGSQPLPNFGIDNARFTGVNVPTPGAFALVGLAGLSATRRRRSA